MTPGLRIVSIDRSPEAVRQFFEQLGDEPVVLQRDGRAIGVLHPTAALAEQLTRPLLHELQGAWRDIPAEAAQQIADGVTCNS
jgi:hypothetical protein